MSHFTQVKALRPGRNVFDLSYEKKFDFDVGQIIPVCCEEMVPGDTFKFGNEIVINAHPLNAPVYHQINVYVHYFFVPTRLIWSGWEDFITGGIDGNDASLLPRLNAMVDPSGTSLSWTNVCKPFTLYDYFGFPIIKDSSNDYSVPGAGVTSSDSRYFFRPLVFPWNCYNLVWNEYYRDETLQNEVSLNNAYILNRNWPKDYFTSALPFQQRGTSPALPLSGTAPVLFSTGAEEIPAMALYGGTVGSGVINDEVGFNDSSSSLPVSAKVRSATVSFNNAATFDVSDLRLAFQLQKFMERAARGGVRYTEFLTSFFGVAPTDARLQRPEYLGGSKSPILINQVTQTSESGTTPQGTLRGKGITADKNYVGKYTASEFGYLIGLLSVLPMPSYQQGIDRKWLRKVKSDFYFPMFAHLSEQAVTEEEVYALPGVSTEGNIGNDTVFGYQAPYNEMRQNRNLVAGSLRSTLSYWHMGRIFDTAPSLNSDFITCNAANDHLNRIYAVQNVPGLVCNFANIITAIRPIPKYGEPGLIDHS